MCNIRVLVDKIYLNLYVHELQFNYVYMYYSYTYLYVSKKSKNTRGPRRCYKAISFIFQLYFNYTAQSTVLSKYYINMLQVFNLIDQN